MYSAWASLCHQDQSLKNDRIQALIQSSKDLLRVHVCNPGAPEGCWKEWSQDAEQ